MGVVSDSEPLDRLDFIANYILESKQNDVSECQMREIVQVHIDTYELYDTKGNWENGVWTFVQWLSDFRKLTLLFGHTEHLTAGTSYSN